MQLIQTIRDSDICDDCGAHAAYIISTRYKESLLCDSCLNPLHEIVMGACENLMLRNKLRARREAKASISKD